MLENAVEKGQFVFAESWTERNVTLMYMHVRNMQLDQVRFY